MSPWSNDSRGSRGADINVGIGTREIAWGPRASRWTWMRKPAPVSGALSVAMPDTQCFTETGIFNALRAALGPAPDGAPPHEKQAPARTRSAHIVLDDFWGNHAILRGDFRPLRAREVDEIARAHFVDTYGVDAESIIVRACVQRGGRAVFASALPRTLIEGVRESGKSLGFGVEALTLCLPQMLNRTLDKMPQPCAMLIFADDALMQAVLIEHGNWIAYDAQRLFTDDASAPARVAALAEQAFEHCAEQMAVKREDCAIGLYGFNTDSSLLEARFASVTMLASPSFIESEDAGMSAARHLLEYAS